MELFGDLNYWWLVIFVITAFFAGYIDAIAGGGGMLQAPVLLFSGLPAIHVLATNKLANLCGTAIATLKYFLSKKISMKVVRVAVIPCLLISYFGSELVMYISDDFVKWGILVAILIALFFLFKKNKKTKEKNENFTNKSIILATTPIAFYDGVLGPGTGTYMAISMKNFLHLDYLVATASTKPLNLATNIGSAIAFIFAGKVLWIIAIPMALSNMLGAYVGSHYAIKGGEVFIKKMLVFILIFMLLANIVKMVFY